MPCPVSKRRSSTRLIRAPIFLGLNSMWVTSVTALSARPRPLNADAISPASVRDDIEGHAHIYPSGPPNRSVSNAVLSQIMYRRYCREMAALPARSMNFCTLPVAVFGNSSTNVTHCGVLKCARLCRT